MGNLLIPIFYARHITGSRCARSKCCRLERDEDEGYNSHIDTGHCGITGLLIGRIVSGFGLGEATNSAGSSCASIEAGSG